MPVKIFNKSLHSIYTAVGLFIMMAAGIIIYSNTFDSPLMFDDEFFIIKDTAVHMTELSPDAIKTAAVDGRPKHRYLPNISFAFNYYFGQLNPFGYHLVNLVIHLLSGIFLFFFIKNTLRLSIKSPKALRIGSTQAGINPAPTINKTVIETFDYKTNPDVIAFFAALLWIVQPVGTQAVTYICQRMASMVALFYILSLLCYVKGRMAMAGGRKTLPYGGSGALVENVEKYNTIDDPLNPCRGGVYPRPDDFNSKHLADGFSRAQKTDNPHNKFLVPILYFAGSFLAALCAFATKENAGTLPLVIILYEWFFFQNLKFKWSGRQILWVAFFVIIFAGVVFWYMGENPLIRILNSYRHRDFSLIERVMTEWRIVVYYLSLFLWAPPGRLNLDHDYSLSLSPLHPATTMFAFAAIFSLLIWAAYAAKKNRLIAFCLLWFFITQATESSIIGIELIFEHRTYIPFMMISLLFTLAIFRFFKNRSMAHGLLVATALVFSIWTYQRNQIWQDPVTFLTDCTVKSPKKYRPQYNLGIALYDGGDISGAIAQYKIAIQTDPDRAAAHNNLGDALLKQGNIHEAIQSFHRALDLKPDFAEAHNNIGNAFFKLGKIDEASHGFHRALTLNPDHIEAHNNLANLLMQKGDIRGAISHFQVILRKQPDHVEANINMGAALAQLGQIDAAIRHYQTALESDPNNPEAHNNMGVLLAQKSMFPEALEQFKRALALRPGYMNALNNLRRLEQMRGYKE